MKSRTSSRPDSTSNIERQTDQAAQPWPRFFQAIPGGRWLWRYGVYLLAGAFFVGFGIRYLHDDNPSEWRTCYVQAAQQMQAGEPIYRIGVYCYAYPPAMAMYAIPLANLPVEASLAGWYLVNVFATCLVFWCAWNLVGGPRLGGLNRTWTLVFWLSLLLSARMILSPLENRQADMCIAALALVGCVLLARGRDLSAAVSLGLAASMKLTPLLFAPYLVWRGKFKAAVVLGAVCVGVNLAPDFLFPQKQGTWYLAEWRRVFFQESTAKTPGEWVAADKAGKMQLNQSLSGLVHRYLRYGLIIPSQSNATAADELSPMRGRVIRGVTYGTALSLLAITAWFMWRAGRPISHREAMQKSAHDGALPASWQLAVEASAVFSLMLLLSPMSSKAHYVVMLLPSLVVARCLVLKRDRAMTIAYALLLVAGPLTAKGVLGKSTGDMLALWGIPTYFPIVSLCAMWLLLARIRANKAAATDNEEGGNRGGQSWENSVSEERQTGAKALLRHKRSAAA